MKPSTFCILAAASVCWSAHAAVYYPADVEELRSALWNAGQDFLRGEGPSEVILADHTVYGIEDKLLVYPGTILTLGEGTEVRSVSSADSYLIQGVHFDESGNVCYGNEGCSHGGYGQCHDVVIQGGTWDMNASASQNNNGFYFRHSSNIVVRSTIIRKGTNHFLNFSGSTDVVVDGVTFEDAVKCTGNNPDFWGDSTVGDPERYTTIEALHLDYITSLGEPGAYPVDKTPCRNIFVTNCVFRNVFAGIGTHHVNSTGGEPSTGIEVVDCRFEGLTAYAIDAFGFEDLWIHGCELDATVRGSGFLIASASDCRIEDNVSEGGTENTIHLYNGTMAEVVGNTLSGAGEVAVRGLSNAKLTVSDNMISSTRTHGVSVSDGAELTASGNTIVHAGQHGFYVKGATATISGNAVESPVQAGIRGDASAIVTVEGNTISAAGTYGISMAGSSKLIAKSNTIQSPKKYGIILDSCQASTISGNTITSSGSIGIRLNKTNGSTVSSNKITGTASGCDGILFDTCKTGTISGNNVSKTGAFAVRIVGTKATPASITVSNNTLKAGSTKYADLKLGNYCQKCKVSGNVLVNRKYSASGTGLSGNKYVPGLGITLSSAVKAEAGTSMTVKWTQNKNVDGYQIQYADNASFTSPKSVSVAGNTKLSKSITGLSAKKRYYVRIRTYDKLTGSACYSSWSSKLCVLPSWAMGTFRGYVWAKGTPGFASMTVANTGAIRGNLTFDGIDYPFSASDYTSFDGTAKAFKLKLSIPVNAKTWTPTFQVAAVTGGATVGVAKFSCSTFRSEMDKQFNLIAGKLVKIRDYTKKFGTTATNADILPDEQLWLTFRSGDVVDITYKTPEEDFTTSGCFSVYAVKKSGTSLVYYAKIPVLIPEIGYAKIVTAKVTRASDGKCTLKYSFAGF